MISGDAYLAKKESKKRDCLNGYTYFKFLNAGLNIGYTLKSKNKEKRKILNFDLSIFELLRDTLLKIEEGLNPLVLSNILELKEIKEPYSRFHPDANSPESNNYWAYRYFKQYYNLNDDVKVKIVR